MVQPLFNRSVDVLHPWLNRHCRGDSLFFSHAKRQIVASVANVASSTVKNPDYSSSHHPFFTHYGHPFTRRGVYYPGIADLPQSDAQSHVRNDNRTGREKNYRRKHL